MSPASQNLASVPNSQRLIVIDPALAQDAALLAQLPQGARVLVLDPEREVLEQLIEAAAAQPQSIQMLDILSHGGEGFVSLGALRLDAATLPEHADALAQLGQLLAPGADLLLYGCSVATGGTGQAFIEALAQATGADVAASTNATGAADQGGDSVLERWAGTGHLDAEALDLSDWPGLLALPANGVVSFSNAVPVPNSSTSFTTADGFFLVRSKDGYTANGVNELFVNSTGAYINDFAKTSAGTSWIEVKVKDSGSFVLTDAVIGEFTNSQVPANANNFYDVYVVGMAGGLVAVQTAKHTSPTGVLEADYNFDFSSFANVRIDTVRVYYSWASGTQQNAFSLTQLSIANASTTAPAVPQQPNHAPTLEANAARYPVFLENASIAADIFSDVDVSAVETAQNIDRITLTVSNLAHGVAEQLRVDGKNIALVQGTSLTTHLGLTVDVSVSVNTATVTLSKSGGITAAQATQLIEDLGYRSTWNLTADSTRVVTLTSLRDTGGTASNGVNTTALNIASTVTLKQAVGAATDELVDVRWNHTVTDFAKGFHLDTNVPLGTQGVSSDSGIYLETGSTGWFEVSADQLNVGTFDLTAVLMEKYVSGNITGVPYAFTLTVSGTRQDGSHPAPVTITSAAGSSAFSAANFSQFTGLTQFRVDISTSGAGSNVNYLIFDGFRITDVREPNAAPVIGLLHGDTTLFTEDGSAVLLDAASNATVTDTDSSNFAGGHVSATISSGAAAGEDRLSIRHEGNGAGQINVSGTSVTYGGTTIGSLSGDNSTALVVSLNANATAAAVQALVRNLSYSNSNSTDPSTAVRIVNISVNDGDGGTSTAAVTVQVTAVNDAPTVSATPLNATYTEGVAAVSLFAAASVSTVEAGQGIQQMVFTVTGLKDGAHEKLVVDGTLITLTNGLSGTTAQNGVTYLVTTPPVAGNATVWLTKTGGLSPATAQTLLTGMAYVNTSENPDTSTSRNITLSLITDTGGTANGGVDTTVLSLTSTVSIVAVNDAPTLTAIGSLSGASEDTSYTITYAALLASANLADVDSSPLSFRVEALSSGTLTKGISPVVPGTTLLSPGESLVWTPAPNANGLLPAFTVRGWDGALASTAPVQVNVQVAAVNDAPTDIQLSNPSVAENSDTTAALDIGTLSTTDVDLGQSFSYSIVGGADQSVFEIAGNGLLRFKAGTVLDHEAQSSYQVIVRSTDSGSPALHYDKTLTILVTDVNEAPALAHPLQDQGASVTRPFHYELPANAFSDPDDGDTLGYSAALADGSPWPAWLVFDPVHRSFDGTPPLGSAGTLTIRVTALDHGGLSATDEFDLVIKAGPTVQSIVRANSAAELTNADTLLFTVTFSEAVSGVTDNDFLLGVTGNAAGTVSSVVGSGATYTVTVNQVTGDGTLRLNLKNEGTGIQSQGTGLDILGGHEGEQSFLLDNTPPPPPGQPALDAGSDTGASHSDGITRDATPTLTGNAEAGSTVELFAGNLSLGSTQADAVTGAWSITPTEALDDGPHTLTVKATDAAGNVSPSSPGRAIVVDTQAPATLTLSITDSGAADGVTRLPTVTVGNLEANASWEYSTDGGQQWWAGSNGSFELAEGSYAAQRIQARQTDVAGNTSTPAQFGSALTVDNTAPEVSSVDLPADGTYAAGAELNFALNFNEAVTVTGVPRLVLTVGNDTLYADYLSGNGGTQLLFRATVPAGWEDTDGIVLASVLDLNGGSLRDVAGNDATLTLNQVGLTSGVRVDGIAPDTPVITSAALTRVAAPVLEGSAESGSQVSVSVGGATYEVEAIAGLWRVDLAHDLPASGDLALNANGDNTVSVFTTDAAGNASETAKQTLRIDTQPPAAPEILSAPITASPHPVISGTAEAGSEVFLSIGGATYSVTATDGSWRVDLESDEPTQGTLALDFNGSNALSVTATDAAGNTSTPAEQTLQIDTSVPDAPTALTLASESDTGASPTDGITRDATPTLTGEAEADSTVTVYSGNTLLGSTRADGDGHWRFTPEVALGDGAHGLSATATDAAGNTSSGSFILQLIIDTTAPSTPALDRTSIRTHAGLDAVVGNLSSTDSTGPVVFALIGGAGSTDNALFSLDGQKLVLHDPAAAGAGPRTVRVSVTDLAGNSSEQSFTISVNANTAPTLDGLPAAAQPVTVGQASALADLVVGDADGDALTVTLTPLNGRIGGLPASGSGGATWTEAEGVLTLRGAASGINALLTQATFTATTSAPASITIRVSDGIVSAPVTATYALTPGIVLTASDASELLTGSSGNDRIDGGGGIDWLAYAGALAAHGVQAGTTGEWQVRSASEGTDTLRSVERLLFSDGALALDLQDQGHAAQAARLITTLLGPQTLDNRALAGEVLAYVDAVGPVQLLQTLQELGVLSALAGGDAPEQLATLIYTNLVGQAPNDAQLQELLDYQSAHGLDAVGLVWAAAQLPLAAQRAGLAETSTTGWAFEVFGGVLFGSAQDDTLTASVVAQHIDGREGIDTLVYAGTRAQHEVHLREGGGWAVERSGPFTDQLVNVERLQFSDGALALDLDGHAGEAARLLATLAGAQALDDAALVGLVLKAVDEQGLDGAARLAVESGFAAQWAGGDTLQQLIANAYVHITGHAAADWELQAFADHAQASGWDNAQTLAVIARLPDTAQSIDLVGLSQQGLAYEPWIGG